MTNAGERAARLGCWKGDLAPEPFRRGDHQRRLQLERYAALKCAAVLRDAMWGMVSEPHSGIDYTTMPLSPR